MSFLRVRSSKYLLFLTICIVIISLSYIRAFYILPDEITLLEGDEEIYKFSTPLFVNAKIDRDGIVELIDNTINLRKGYFAFSNPFFLKSRSNGSVNVTMSLLGLIPFKTMKVDIVSNRRVVACGCTVGVKLKTDGILVIGISNVDGIDGRRSVPAKDAGIRPGDFITEANGKRMEDINSLMEEIDNSNGNPIELKYRRGQAVDNARITPAKAADDSKYHIGLWVRDNTAGIGTLTFFDPRDGSFGALGHGITDIDTGTLMSVSKGEILESSILGIKKGVPGHPGELKGVFTENNKLGSIRKNSEYGIYGNLNSWRMADSAENLYPIAVRSQIKEGPAYILSNIEGRKVEKFSVEILKVSRQSMNGSKGMVIKITDSRLLGATGGIVQGMSGSPIIQDDRIIGAVTHVLVNDPSRGYGIFIEGMIKNLTGNNKIVLEKAG